MVMTIIVFLIHKILFILTGRRQQVTPPTGAEDKTTTQQKSVYIDHRKGESKAVVPSYPEAKYKERTYEKE